MRRGAATNAVSSGFNRQSVAPLLAVLAALPLSTWGASALDHLRSEPKPRFAEKHTLPPLTRWGWRLPVELQVELCEKWGYALDSMDTEGIVTRAPSANRLMFIVYGRDAHAGAFPEQGINAISIASLAISRLQLGRIDEETTCNIGMI